MYTRCCIKDGFFSWPIWVLLCSSFIFIQKRYCNYYHWKTKPATNKKYLPLPSVVLVNIIPLYLEYYITTTSTRIIYPLWLITLKWDIDTKCDFMDIHFQYLKRLWYTTRYLRCWWYTHWCENISEPSQLHTKDIFDRFKDVKNIWSHWWKGQFSLYQVSSCFCNTISSIDCCHCNIIQFSFVLNIFMLYGSKYYTYILYFLFWISCVLPYTIQPWTIVKV